MLQVYNCITTNNGKYYAGMTIDEAKNKKSFSKIDTNKDNFLSTDEIFTNRNKEAEASKLAGIVSMGLAIAGMLFMRFGILGALLFGEGYYLFRDYQKINSTSKQLKTMLENIEK